MTHYPLKTEGGFRFTIGKARVTKEFHEHTHDYTELVVILGGTGTHVIDGRSYYITAGDVYVFQGSASHGFFNADDLDMCNIGFAPAILAPLEHMLKTLPGYQALFVLGPATHATHDFACRMRLTLAERPVAERMIDALIAEARRKEEGYEAVITAMFTEFVVYLSRLFAKQRTRAAAKDVHGNKEISGDGLRRLAETVSHLERNYRSDLRLADIAKRAGTSERQFLRLFREHYQTTPIDYLLKLKVMHASRLLAASDASVTDIAFESGFSDSNYFARQFRRITGETPRAYRARERTSPR